MSELDKFLDRISSDCAAKITLEAMHGEFTSMANFQEAQRQGLSIPKRVKIKSDNLPSAPMLRYNRARYR